MMERTARRLELERPSRPKGRRPALIATCLAALFGIALAGCSSATAPYSNTDLKARCESKNGKWYGDPYGDPTHGFCEFNSPR